MTKDYLTSPFNDENLKRILDSINSSVNKLTLNSVPPTTIQSNIKNMISITKEFDYNKFTANSKLLFNISNSDSFKSIGTIVKSANYIFDSSYLIPEFSQMTKILDQISQNINLSTNSTNFSHLFRDVHLVSSDAIFNHSPLRAWEECKDDSIFESPSNTEEKTSNEIDNDKVRQISNNLLEQATDYGKKFSHGFFAPIKDPEELGKLVFETIFSSLISIFFSIAITYGMPAAQYIFINLWLEIQRRISRTQ